MVPNYAKSNFHFFAYKYDESRKMLATDSGPYRQEKYYIHLATGVISNFIGQTQSLGKLPSKTVRLPFC